MTYTYEPVGLHVMLWFPPRPWLQHPVWELREANEMHVHQAYT